MFDQGQRIAASAAPAQQGGFQIEGGGGRRLSQGVLDGLSRRGIPAATVEQGGEVVGDRCRTVLQFGAACLVERGLRLPQGEQQFGGAQCQLRLARLAAQTGAQQGKGLAVASLAGEQIGHIEEIIRRCAVLAGGLQQRPGGFALSVGKERQSEMVTRDGVFRLFGQYPTVAGSGGSQAAGTMIGECAGEAVAAR